MNVVRVREGGRGRETFSMKTRRVVERRREDDVSRENSFFYFLASNLCRGHFDIFIFLASCVSPSHLKETEKKLS